jgi:hypothetical protein
MSTERFTEIMTKADPNFKIKEIASIHVKDYDLMFGKPLDQDAKVHTFLAYRESSVAFVKVYLIHFT